MDFQLIPHLADAPHPSNTTDQGVDFIGEYVAAQHDPTVRDGDRDGARMGDHTANGRPHSLVQDVIIGLVLSEAGAYLGGGTDGPVPGIPRGGCQPISDFMTRP
jgi:hypothetical protein